MGRHRTRTVVKNRYQRTGPRATTPAAQRGKPGTGGRRSPGTGAERLSRVEMQEWTRRVMADLEQRLARELVWYAVVHRHNDHPHVHVIIGASTAQASGRQEGVRFTRADFQSMRESGDRHVDQIRRHDALLHDVEQYLAAAA